ncbi:hypothetical protein MY11210_000372 [Beauveria gryllotalpidicola]
MWGSTDESQPDWLSSKEFKFIVGPEGQEFMVHSALVAEQSKPLDALVTNGMKESLQGTVEWPHVDVATFEKFSKYLYTGDFLSPCFEPFANVQSDRTCIANTWPKFDDDKITQKAWVRFRTRKRYAFHELPTVYEAFPYRINYYEDSDHSEVFLSVARVYTFAHYYDIRKLMRFCQAKIHSLMALAPGRQEVCNLLQLCKDEPAAAGLKELVFEYCALNLRWLLAGKKFHTIIEEYPEASLGIMKKMKSFNTFYFKLRSKEEIDFPADNSSDSEAEWYRESTEH